MKKKKWIRCLSFVLCLSFLILTGCGADGSGIGGSGGNREVEMLDGVKVLSRPADYSFGEAVGEFSENYYNLYARYILYYLDDIYNTNNSVNSKIWGNVEGYKDLVKSAQEGTFSNLNGNPDEFLLDSSRYTIETISQGNFGYDANTDTYEYAYEIVIDTSSKWNWSIGITNSFETYFSNFIDDMGGEKNVSANSITFYTNSGDPDEIFRGVYRPTSYSEQIYSNKDEPKKDENGADTLITNYFQSPYYASEYPDAVAEGTTYSNYFQDALEYVNYLFVLGYDYNTYDTEGKVNGTNTDDAPYFDFSITYATDGSVSKMEVGGWGTSKISVVDALKNVKERYNEAGNYIGVTEKNIEQISRFILDKIIGTNARTKNQFAILTNMTDANGDAISYAYNRNYEAIAYNIVKYACDMVPIGLDANGNNLTLNNSYAASKITDYKGEYFFINPYDSNGNEDEEHMFDHIEAAEYQSMIFMPRKNNVGSAYEDIWLAFQYYDNPSNKVMLDKLTINVGFRFYSYSQKKVVSSGEKKITIVGGTWKEQNGRTPFVKLNGEELSGANPDTNWCTISFSDEGGADIVVDKYTIGTRFNNNMAEGVINPFVSGTKIDDSYAYKYLNGTDKAKDFYTLRNSSSYGQYSVFNEELIGSLADGCDFIEIYFDIEKDKTQTNVNYNFKVGLCGLFDANEKSDSDLDDFDDGFEDL